MEYTYSNGNLSAITRTEDDDTVQTYSFAYDAFGNALSASVGDRMLATYEYEPGNGLLKKQTYGNGDVISFTYDDLGRTKTVTYDDGTTVTYIYNGEGAVYSITEEQGTNTTLYLYTYDSISRLIGCEKKVNGETVLRTYQEFNEHNQQTHYGYQMGDESYSESYTYNADGTLNQIVGNDGRTVTMSYDELQRLSGKTVKQGDTTVVSYTYSYRDISETATTTQIASVQVTAANRATTYAYTYDSSGNILSVSDGTNTTSYVYDSMNQLLRENNQAANKTWVWTYDNAGNIQSKSEYAYTTGELGEAVDTVSYGYTDENWGDLLTSYDGNAIIYDEIGNPLSDGTWTYTWENGRQLASMTDGTTTWSYEYNADGLRTSRTDGTTTYQYVYNGGSLVQMTVGSNTLYFTSDTVTFNGVTYYYVKNLQGDVTAIVDGSGATVATYVYDAWGNLISDEPAENTIGHLNPIRYRGYMCDSESELYYLQSRYYDPELGRFLNADAFASTGQGILGNNMFAYCGNNPVNRIDLFGNSWIGVLITGVIVGILLNGCSDSSINCYTYVLMSEEDSTVNESLNKRLDPGDLAGDEYDKGILFFSPESVIYEFDKRIKSDAETLGYNCKVIDNATGYIPTEGNWLIAAAYCPAPSQADYHFWRRHSDGTWSHKPGSKEVMYCDFSNNTINDPYFCDRDRYTQFIGYYEIGPN